MSSPATTDTGAGAITSTSNDPAGPEQPKLLVSVTVMVPLPATAAALIMIALELASKTLVPTDAGTVQVYDEPGVRGIVYITLV